MLEAVLTLHLAAEIDETYVHPEPASQQPPPWVQKDCPATEHPLGMVSKGVVVVVTAVIGAVQTAFVPTVPQSKPKSQHAPPREEGQAYAVPMHLRGEHASWVMAVTVGEAAVVIVVVVVRLKA